MVFFSTRDQIVYRGLGRLENSLGSGRAALGLLRDVDHLQTKAYVLTSMANSHAGLGHYPSMYPAAAT